MQKTPIKSKSHTRAPAALLKVVVFQMGNLNLALPAKNIYRILKQSSDYGGGFNSVSITHVGDSEALPAKRDRGVTVVDLHRRLFQSSITNQVQGSHLVVAEDKEGQLYGIPVAAVPALMNVSSSSIQVLPDSYRHANTLGMVSHYCHISEGMEESMTIFLLDVEQLMADG